MCIKGFKAVFYVSGSLIDDKNVHKGLKFKICLKTWLSAADLSYFKKFFFVGFVG